MFIHRNKKERNFVTLDKTVLNDAGLSWSAKGLHSYLMGLPDDWKVNLADLTNRALDGKHAVTSAMNELLKAGYVIRRKVLNSKKQFLGYEYQVFETSKEAAIWESENGKAVVGKPDYGKSENGFSENGKLNTTNSIDIPSIDIPNIEVLNIESDTPEFSGTFSPQAEYATLKDRSSVTEITEGADSPKTKRSKAPNEIDEKPVPIYDKYATVEAFVAAWQASVYAAKHPKADPAKIYEDLLSWSRENSHLRNKGKKKDWLATASNWYAGAFRPEKFHYTEAAKPVTMPRAGGISMADMEMFNSILGGKR